ncbi:MAG: serine/threonine protein kinase [Candidatus Eremiobacteraeota bacterium]|nr:serine/threonine protein kinase [Candidatus Eremiobacteraeota bacterium]
MTLLVLLVGPASAREYPITIQSTAPGAVWVRSTNTEQPFQKVSENTPYIFQAEAGQYIDIEVRGRQGPFTLLRGSQQNRNGPASVTVHLYPEVDWARLVWAVLIPAVLVTALLVSGRRRLRQDYQAAEKRALVAEAHTGIPLKIGPYKVRGKLGQGGMAIVYEVEDRHGDIYALKVPQDQSERSRREWRMLYACTHPGIVRLHDFYESQDPELPSYLVMELLEGESLEDRLAREGKLAPAEASRLMRELFEALAYAHAQGVVHRDLKPGNVFLAKDRLKLVDFGIAKAEQLGNLTATGELLGTPAYAAPEQIESKAVDHRCDLYAAGVMFYEMVTGVLPWQASDPVALLMKKARGLPEPPSHHRPDLPPGYDEPILRLLNVQADLRPASAEQALAEVP